MKIIAGLLRLRVIIITMFCLAALFSAAASPWVAGPSSDSALSLTVRVFYDTIGSGFPCPGCNGIFDAGDGGIPLPPLEIIIRDAETGQPIARQSTHYLPSVGASFAWFSVSAESTENEILVELASVPASLQLCPNAPSVRRLPGADSAGRQAFVSYALWAGCPVLATPTPTATATPTASPTPTATPSPTPSPTPTSTATPTATFTSTPTPTATVCPVEIAGRVWEDVNGDGLREPDEPALAHAIVTLWQGEEALQSVVTGGEGRYSFPALTPGAYRVVETDPPGFRSTTANEVEIEAGCGMQEHDFGDQLATECPRGVSGVVWNDRNGDGVLEIGEPPLPGATLRFYDSAGAEIRSQVTGLDGVYLFEGLASDVYTLIEENPAGFPTSTTLDFWEIDLLGCRVRTINFGDR